MACSHRNSFGFYMSWLACLKKACAQRNCLLSCLMKQCTQRHYLGLYMSRLACLMKACTQSNSLHACRMKACTQRNYFGLSVLTCLANEDLFSAPLLQLAWRLLSTISAAEILRPPTFEPTKHKHFFIDSRLLNLPFLASNLSKIFSRMHDEIRTLYWLDRSLSTNCIIQYLGTFVWPRDVVLLASAPNLTIIFGWSWSIRGHRRNFSKIWLWLVNNNQTLNQV